MNDSTPKSDPWEVSAKDDRPFAYEVSIVRASNDHGKKSYGWGGPRKLVIAHHHFSTSESNADDRYRELMDLVFKSQVEMARGLMLRINAQENS